MKEVTGLEPRDYSSINGSPEKGYIQKETVSVKLSIQLTSDPIKIIRAVQEKISDSSYLVFLGESSLYHDDKMIVELVVGRGNSQEDIVRLAETSAPSYELDTEGVITQLKKLYEHAEIEIIGADESSVSIRVKRVKTNLEKLSKVMFSICVDLCQNEIYSDEKTLANYLKEDDLVIFRWD